MGPFSKEKLERLKKLAEGNFLESSNEKINKFLKRMEIEGAPVFADVYSGEMSFYNAPKNNKLNDIDIAIIGVPMETSAPVRGGTRLGPRSAREWSKVRGPVHDVWRTIPFEMCSVADYGDIIFEDPHNVVSCVNHLSSVYSDIKNAGVRPLSIGGVHTMTHPILRGLSNKKGIGLVHIDSHADTAKGSFQGSPINDCSVFLNAVLEESIDPEKCIQIGIRGSLTPYWDFSRQSGMTVIEMHEYLEMGLENVIKKIHKVIGNNPFYLSIDTDAIDATFLPGTQLPEPFGFTTREIIQMLRKLKGMDIIGADIVELCPPYDPHGISANIVAAIGFEILCLLAESHTRKFGVKRKTSWSKKN